MFVSRECCVLSGTGSCDGPIPRPEKSYRMCICVSMSVIRCNRNPLHQQWAGTKVQTKKERTIFSWAIC